MEQTDEGTGREETEPEGPPSTPMLWVNRDEIREWIAWSRANFPREGDIPDIDVAGFFSEDSTGLSDELLRSLEKPLSSPRTHAGWALQWFRRPLRPLVSFPWFRDEWPSLSFFANLEAEDLLRDRCEAKQMFRKELAQDRTDTAARFMAFSWYYRWATAHCDLKEQTVAPARRACLEDLRELVGLLPVRECPGDWRVIRWEIRVACAAKDWERALDLFDCAAANGVIDKRELRLWRGQIGFLSVFDQEIEGFTDMDDDPLSCLMAPWWCLRRFDAEDPETRSAIYKAGLLDPAEKFPLLTGAERARVRDTCSDLEQALEDAPDLPALYRAMLARCRYSLEDPRSARDYALFAEKGDGLVERELAPRFEVQKWCLRRGWALTEEECPEMYCSNRGEEDFRPRIYYSLARSYRLADKPDEARNALQQWLGEHPNEPSAFRLLADLAAQAGRYQEASDHLRRAVELDPQLHDDLGMSTARALVSAPAASEQMQQLVQDYLAKHPGVLNLIDSILTRFWPTYGVLTTASKECVKKATMLLYYMEEVEPSAFLDEAVTNLAATVEVELREQLFGPFREDLKAKAKNVLEDLKAEGRHEKSAEKLCGYLGGGSITLKEMYLCLDRCHSKKDGVLKRLKDWSGSRCQIFRVLDDLKEITEVRNPVVHRERPTSLEEAKQLPGLCRRVLDALHPKQ